MRTVPKIFSHDASKGLLPRMSWSPHNLYNLMARSLVPYNVSQTTFTRTTASMYQQRWRSKRFLRSYHGDWIPEKRFKRWFLPEALPALQQQRGTAIQTGMGTGSRSSREASAAERMPVASLFVRDIERRADTVVFRACFARSIYEARGLVVHGHVKLNGRKMSNPNELLNPGDLLSVEPSVIPMLNPALAKTFAKHGTIMNRNGSPSIKREEPTLPAGVLPFHLPPFAAPHLFIPPHLEPSFATCSVVFVRAPTILSKTQRAGGQSTFATDLPSPYAAGGDLFALAWEHYARSAPRVRSDLRRQRTLARSGTNGFARQRAKSAWSIRRGIQRGTLIDLDERKAAELRRLKLADPKSSDDVKFKRRKIGRRTLMIAMKKKKPKAAKVYAKTL